MHSNLLLFTVTIASCIFHRYLMNINQKNSISVKKANKTKFHILFRSSSPQFPSQSSPVPAMISLLPILFFSPLCSSFFHHQLPYGPQLQNVTEHMWMDAHLPPGVDEEDIETLYLAVIFFFIKYR